jgi:hypothetical protein
VLVSNDPADSDVPEPPLHAPANITNATAITHKRLITPCKVFASPGASNV